MGSLSAVQHSIIVGSLLGDGSMRGKANVLLEVNHSFRQRFYVDWKYEALRDLVRTPPKARKGNGSRIAYRFVTLALPELTELYPSFYREGRKVAPEVELNPLTLAVWFMDDGCKSRSAVYLNTQQFDDESQLRLIEMLEDQRKVIGRLNRDKCYYRIRITTSSTKRLAEIIDPYLLPGFRYKLPQVTP